MTTSIAPAPSPDLVLDPSDRHETGGPWRRLAEPLIAARDLTRRWGWGSTATLGVDRVDLDLPPASIVAIVGPSGSGKSTLGSLIAGIDQPTSGSLVIDGVRTDGLRRSHLARWRAEHVGIVFQDFHLLPTLTAQENVELAIRFTDRRSGRSARRAAALDALDAVGLGAQARKLPSQMSGGEQQRVAIARAIVNDPSLIVADEPTGSLDQSTGRQVFDLLLGLRRSGSTIVFITHDPTLAERCDRVVEMVDGRIVDHRVGANTVDSVGHSTRAVG